MVTSNFYPITRLKFDILEGPLLIGTKFPIPKEMIIDNVEYKAVKLAAFYEKGCRHITDYIWVPVGSYDKKDNWKIDVDGYDVCPHVWDELYYNDVFPVMNENEYLFVYAYYSYDMNKSGCALNKLPFVISKDNMRWLNIDISGSIAEGRPCLEYIGIDLDDHEDYIIHSKMTRDLTAKRYAETITPEDIVIKYISKAKNVFEMLDKHGNLLAYYNGKKGYRRNSQHFGLQIPDAGYFPNDDFVPNEYYDVTDIDKMKGYVCDWWNNTYKPFNQRMDKAEKRESEKKILEVMLKRNIHRPIFDQDSNTGLRLSDIIPDDFD